MNKKNILSIMLCLLSFASVTGAEVWETNKPGTADIKEGFSVSRSRLGLYVPKSFGGRKANEDRNTFTLELKNRVRFTHYNGDVELTGLANKMQFDYKTDIIDVQVFRSKTLCLSSSYCLDCQKDECARTMVIVGYGQTKADDYTYAGNHFVKSESKYFKTAVDHWMKENLMLRGEFRFGKSEQGTISENAMSMSVGLGGYINHRLTWSGDYVYSKVDTFKARNLIVGRLAYTLCGGLKLNFEAGSFLNGYAQFGSNMTEMGLVTMEPVKRYRDSLPSLFEKLKDDKFGYYNASIEYEILF